MRREGASGGWVGGGWGVWLGLCVCVCVGGWGRRAKELCEAVLGCHAVTLPVGSYSTAGRRARLEYCTPTGCRVLRR